MCLSHFARLSFPRPGKIYDEKATTDILLGLSGPGSSIKHVPTTLVG